MKLIRILITLLAIPLLLSGQEQAEYLNIGLIMPPEHEALTASDLTKLESKLMSVLLKNGISAQAAANGLIAYPQFNIYETERVHAGVATVTVQEMEVCLLISQMDGKVAFASNCITLKGSGKDAKRALQSAIMAIDPNAPSWSRFVAEAKTKILDFYEQKCSMLLIQAKQLQQTGQMEEAFSNLYNIPAEASCYAEASTLSIEIYEQVKEEYCQRNLQLAKAKLAENDYQGALRVIGWIDPTAACHQEAIQVMNTAADKLDEKLKERWDFYKERVHQKEELEKLRIEAIRDIGVAYAQRNPVTNWNIIK